MFWVLISVGVHVALILGTWLILFILQLFGLSIPLFQTAMKQRDIEFVLVDNAPAAKPKQPTNRRAERDSRSGGKKIANRPTQMPQQAAGTPSPKATPQPAVRPEPKPQPSRRPAQPTPNRQVARKPAPQQQPTPPTPKPSPAPPAPKLPKPTRVANNAPSLPPNPIAPTIKTPAPPNPKTASMSGPVVKTPGSGSASGSPSGGSPGPTTIAGVPSRSGSGQSGSPGRTGGTSGSGGRGSYNQSGSPGGGGGAAGIDAIAEPDFGPYIAELQRRIRRNWAPPVEDRSKRVVALFKIARDGRLIDLRIMQSSGSPPADQAALAAVRASAPFRQLPPNYRNNDIDVQFIFDYEIYGHGSARMR